jgi:hypothetical protein
MAHAGDGFAGNQLLKFEVRFTAGTVQPPRQRIQGTGKPWLGGQHVQQK